MEKNDNEIEDGMAKHANNIATAADATRILGAYGTHLVQQGYFSTQDPKGSPLARWTTAELYAAKHSTVGFYEGVGLAPGRAGADAFTSFSGGGGADISSRSSGGGGADAFTSFSGGGGAAAPSSRSSSRGGADAFTTFSGGAFRSN